MSVSYEKERGGRIEKKRGRGEMERNTRRGEQGQATKG